jgi:murein DD-endopeptidase MepM/ murein hydrolase activator NlpD
MVAPVPSQPTVTYPYGAVNDRYESGYHTGNDYFAGYGAAVVAAADGVVYAQGWGVYGPAYGYQIVLRCEGGQGTEVRCLYAHLSDIHVRTGQTVKAGQRIGDIGTSGTNSTGPHLHYEERTSPFLYNNVDRRPRLDQNDNTNQEDVLAINKQDIKEIADAVRLEILQTELFPESSDPALKNVTVRDGLRATVRDHIKNGKPVN